MISVLYISNRYGGLDILKANLKRQTIQDFELVFVDGLYDKRKDEVKNYFDGFNLKHISDAHISKEGFYSKLARCDNLGFKNCDGELIILLQDYIYIPSYGFEKFYEISEMENHKALLTGVGHQYEYPTKEQIVNKEGLITVFEKEFIDKPTNKFWNDPRYGHGGFIRPAQPVEWEMNWAAIPRSVIYDLGGMDEEYDRQGFAWDNTNIAQRAFFLGYPIILDNTNECYGFAHDIWWPNPLKENRISPANYHFEQMGKIQRGEISARLNYLA